MAENKKNRKAVICIPTYNEREGIKELIPQIFDLTKDIKGWDVHILIADDTSPDGTYKEVEKLQKKYKKLHLLLNKEKVGLGGAYLRAFGYAIKEYSPDVIFEMDGDGQHTPTLIPDFLKKIDDGYDFVVGSRYIEGGSIPSHWGIDRKFYSIVGSIVAQLGFMNFKVKDWTSGYRCIKASYLKNVIGEMKGYNGYEFQIALLDKAFKHHLNVGEVPLHFTDRLDGESKFSSIDFIINALKYVLFNSTFLRYAYIGLSGAAIDFLIAGILIVLGTYKPNANAVSAGIAIMYNYLLNNYWAFSHRKIHGKRTHAMKFGSFVLIALGSIAIQWLGIYLTITYIGDFSFRFFIIDIPMWIIYKALIIGMFIIPYSYIMYNTFIWKKPTAK